MDHAITVGEVAGVVGILAALVAACVFFFFLIWLFNPFRTGH